MLRRIQSAAPAPTRPARTTARTQTTIGVGAGSLDGTGGMLRGWLGTGCDRGAASCIGAGLAVPGNGVIPSGGIGRSPGARGGLGLPGERRTVGIRRGSTLLAIATFPSPSAGFGAATAGSAVGPT
jgi:hypothetical protein